MESGNALEGIVEVAVEVREGSVAGSLGVTDGFTEEQLKLSLEGRGRGRLFQTRISTCLAWATHNLQRRISYTFLSQVLGLCG